MATSEPKPRGGRTLTGRELVEFGERLDRLRERAGYPTVKEFSAASGVSESTISRIRSGERGLSVPNLKKMAAALRVTTSELLGRGPDDRTLELDSDTGWRRVALERGHDPDDPVVAEVYRTAFHGAMGAASDFADREIARRRSEEKKGPIGLLPPLTALDEGVTGRDALKPRKKKGAG